MSISITEASAGVVFVLKDKNGERVAALQRRAAGQSMTNGHQGTAHGKLSIEEFAQTPEARHRLSLYRIIEGELGKALADYFQNAVAANEDSLVEVHREVNDKGRELAFFRFEAELSDEIFNSLVSPSTKVSGFTMLSKTDLPSVRKYKPEELRKYKTDAKPEEQTVAVPVGEIAMHADERLAVEKALSLAEKPAK